MVLRSEAYLECIAAVKFRATGMATSKFYCYDTWLHCLWDFLVLRARQRENPYELFTLLSVMLKIYIYDSFILIIVKIGL